MSDKQTYFDNLSQTNRNMDLCYSIGDMKMYLPHAIGKYISNSIFS